MRELPDSIIIWIDNRLSHRDSLEDSAKMLPAEDLLVVAVPAEESGLKDGGREAFDSPLIKHFVHHSWQQRVPTLLFDSVV